jgi:hypothetical protein
METDIFYTKEWAALFEQEMGGKAELFRFEEGTKVAQYPFIKRSLASLPFAAALKEEYFDISSPYGYGGIYLSPEAKNDADFIKKFEAAFDTYCKKERIVAEFIRFHPLDQNQEAFAERYTQRKVNDNAVIDLRNSAEQIWADMDKRHRYSVGLAKRKGVEIVWDEEWNHFDDFKRLYYLTNDRTGAIKFYYFSGAFFNGLRAVSPGNVRLIVSKLDGRVVAASLLLFNPESVYYFLSGADRAGLSACANHLMLYTAVLAAKKEGKKFFNFGGGNKAGDSLSAFKMRFSKLMMPFYIGTRVANKEIYDTLVELSGADKTNSFFPLYIAPKG